ncbi:MAG: hypothetical protein HKP30_05330 [Myxococcales bacterium]|nr:hypothetical protein [Myxococcales bacterium]
MRAQHRPLLILLAVFALQFQAGAGSCAKPLSINITTPTHGEFTTQTSVNMSGSITGVGAANASLTVNGVPVTVQGNNTFSTTLTLDPAIVFNPFLVELVNTANGTSKRKRVVVIAGDSVADGALSAQSVALRLNDSGLDSVEPIVTSLVDLDIASLLPPGTTVISDFCAIGGPFGSCLGSVDVTIENPAPSFSSFGLDVDSLVNAAAGDVTINDLLVFTRINGSGLAPSCNLTLSANSLDILGDYSLEPDGVDPSNIDVNLVTSPPGIVFSGFDSEFTSGLCDFPLIGSLIQLIIGDIQPLVVGGLQSFLDDPDGSGPVDAPIAEGIEVALADIQISGPIGESLGLDLETPLFAVTEDNAGITLGSDARITTGSCTPPASAPDLLASLHVPEPFPSFGATTPIGGLPYGLGICISSSAFNQLLKGEIECGLLQTSLTEIDLGGGLVPITAGVLALFIPELGTIDPATPFIINLTPTLAPVLTGNTGPSGEIAELRVGGLALEVRDTVLDAVVISGELDFRGGLNFTFDSMTSELVPSIGTVTSGDITVDIVNNTVMTNPTQLATILSFLLPAVLPTLGDSLGSFPLPTFLGLSLQGVGVEANGEFISLFVDLVQVP